MEKRINIYTCEKGHKTVTIDRDEGVTPFMIGCEHEGCDELARSGFYQADKDTEPTHEWYKPDSYDGLSDGEIEHVKLGGLLLRKIQ